MTDKYLGCSEYVGIPGDAPQKPFQATQATTAGTKNASGKKKDKKGYRKHRSPAVVVVQSASSLLQPLQEQPGHPHLGSIAVSVFIHT